jgi:antitoxin YqcF
MASVENKAIAKYVLSAFRGKPTVTQFIHDDLPLTIDILACQDCPDRGVVAYSTLGLSDYPMISENKEFPTRLEIAGACAADKKFYPNMLASTAFSIMRSHRLVYPGSIIQNAVTEYLPDSINKHFYLNTPFLWEDSLKTFKLETKTVAWLLLVPICEAEYQYLLEHGDEALEDKFEQAQIDVFDLQRPSCL